MDVLEKLKDKLEKTNKTVDELTDDELQEITGGSGTDWTQATFYCPDDHNKLIFRSFFFYCPQCLKCYNYISRTNSVVYTENIKVDANGNIEYIKFC